jgi:hypothetical protein
MTRRARFSSAALIALLTGALAACANGSDGQYNPDPVDEVSQVDALPGDLAPELTPDVPDLSAVELEPVEPLIVKITGTSARSSFTTSSFKMDAGSDYQPIPFAVIAGEVIGEWDSVYLRTDASDEPILVEPRENGGFDAQVFLRPPQEVGDQLESQPTTLWAVAQKGDYRAYDVAVITANPGFGFPQPLRLVPDVLFAGETSEVLVTLDLNEQDNFLPDQVWVMEVDSTCTTKIQGTARQMKDGGNIAVDGDHLALDKVYSAYLKLDNPEPGMHWFRAAVTTKMTLAGGQEKALVAYSQCLPVRVVERITPVSCASSRDILAETQAVMDEALVAGWTLEQARRGAVLHLREEATVAEAGASAFGDQVWVRFTSGLLGAVQPSAPVSGGAISTPFFHEDGTPPEGDLGRPSSRMVASVLHAGDENHPWQKTVDQSACPPWRDLEPAGSLSLFRRFAEAGIIFVAGRGGPVFGGLSDEGRGAVGAATKEFDQPPPAWLGWDHPGTQEVVWLEDAWSCDSLASGYQTCRIDPDGTCKGGDGATCPETLECIITHGKDGTPKGMLYDRTQADLAAGRVLLGADRIGLLPSFFQAYSRQGYREQVVFLGIPWSGKVRTTAVELRAAGANSVVACDGDVAPAGAEKAGNQLFLHLLEEETSLAAVLPRMGTSFSDHPWRLHGSGTIDLTDAAILNVDFGRANLMGWRREGDARVLYGWCGESAATNTYMAVVSNGLAWALDVGEISQEFCLSKDKVIFEAYYNFVSHEFMDSCGSEFYEDRFEMFMEDEDGQRLTLVGTANQDYIGLNALCPCDAGECPVCGECGSPACVCGELNQPELGLDLTLWPEECRFDSPAMGDAYASGWRETGEVPLSNLGQGGFDRPVRMVIRVSDESGHKGNTAVLVDSIKLK